MHADELRLPFDDGAFDAVCCFAALHRISEPIGVLREMVRVLAPRRRIALLTSCGRESFLVQKGPAVGATICGVRVFDRTTVPAFCCRGGDRQRPATSRRDLPVRHGTPTRTGAGVRPLAHLPADCSPFEYAGVARATPRQFFRDLSIGGSRAHSTLYHRARSPGCLSNRACGWAGG